MPRWKTPRWMLGAPALIALAVAGCGAAASQPKLHRTSERRLLSLVARARTDASQHNGAAVHAVLGEFVSDVQTLTTSGQLSHTTAGRLDREARATAAQAARRLRPAAKVAAKRAGTVTRATAATTTTAAANSTPTTQRVPPPASVNPPGPAGQPGPGNQGDVSDSPAPGPGQPGPGHGRGHAYGHDGWSDGGQAGANRTWAQWWSYFTGGRGD